MRKYVALLRGVNVGGKNKIPMGLLKAAFEGAGFDGVSTYINSGNIFFASDEEDSLALQTQCREIIMDAFGLDIAVAVISREELSDALNNAPSWWDKDADAKHNAIFVIAPAAAGSVMEAVGDAKPDYEKVAFRGPVIFWSAPRETFSRTRWSKVSGSAAYSSITIRNANTAKKILQLME